MRAGSFDRRVTIQRKQLVPDSLGQQLGGWCDVATVWARLEVPTGGESFVEGARQRSARQRATFTVRWNPDVLPTMRLLHATQVYDIVDVAPDGRREYLVLTCDALEAKPVTG